MIMSRSILLAVRNVLDKRCTENQNAPPPPLIQYPFFGKSYRLWSNVETRGATTRQATGEYNTAHVLCMLGNKGYRHTLGTYNTYFLSTATMVTRPHLKVTSTRTVPIILNRISNKHPKNERVFRVSRKFSVTCSKNLRHVLLRDRVVSCLKRPSNWTVCQLK